jgi:hypothetical protein
LAERPIIRLQLPGDTVDEFQRAAAVELGREFFVELDTPVGELVRIEAPFKSGAIAVRAEAMAKSAVRDGKSGAIIRLTKIEPNSYGVAIPPASAWPRAEDVKEVVRAPVIARTATPVPKPAISRTATPHVIKRVLEIEADDPGDEFSEKASITKNSPVSADLAKQLNERPTPQPPPTPRTPAIIRRATPVAGIPSIPKPVEKKIATPPSVPPVDDEWNFDAPTLGPAVKAAGPVLKPEIPKAKPPSIPAMKTPPKGTPAVKKLDDDAAFDDAFGMLDEDLAVAVEAPKPRAVSEPKIRAASEPKPRAVSEPKPRAVSEPKLRAASEPKPRAISEPKPNLDFPVVAKADETTTPELVKAELVVAPSAPVEASGLAEVIAARVDEITKPVPAEVIAKNAQESVRPTPQPDAQPRAASEPKPKHEPVPRPSSEGVLATPRASELAMTNEIDAIEQGTSTGVTAASRAASEAAMRTTPKPKSKLPLILVIAAALIGGVVAVVLATRGGGEATKKETPKSGGTKAEVDKHLREAASRIADGKLVGRGGDAALDHLLAAKALAPKDPQVLAQLTALADTFEKLGDGAAAANDLAEAATHYQAALTAEPDRASAKTKLADVENKARGK